MRFRHPLLLCVAAMLVAVAGCSDPESADAPSVDIAALDSGNYPVVPRDLTALGDPKYGPLREAVRIGAAVPLISEVDGRFPFQRLSGPVRRVIPGVPPALWAMDAAEFADATPGLLTGWTTSAERRREAFVGRQITEHVLRFTDAAAAEAAADRLTATQARNAPGDTVPIPDFPAARAKFTPAKRYLDAWLPRGSLLLSVHAEDPVSEPLVAAPLTELAQHLFAASIDRLASYQPTPADQFTSIPVDVDGLLSRTLPPERIADAKTDGKSSLMPAQAALHYDSRPAETKAAFDDAGVDLVAFSDARLYRTRDSAAADRLIAAFVAQIADGTKAIDSPAGLASTRCFDAKDNKSSGTYQPVCFIPYQRIVARVTGGNIQELHQKAAAQYKLLAAG